MIEDRQYMRRPARDVYRSATVTLIVINVLVFVSQQLFPHWYYSVESYVALSPEGLKHGYVWQLLTFQFMHANWTHLICNCLTLFFLGNPVEQALGRASFYALYYSSGALGGLVQALLGIFVQGPMFGAAVVGASAGTCGLLAAFALLYPDSLLLLFFIIPIRAKYLLPLGIAVAVVFMFAPSAGGNIAHAAHLGGMIAGFLFVRYAVHWNFHWPQLSRVRKTPRRRRLVRVPAHKPGGWKDTMPVEEDLPADEFLSKEVDPILDKISAQGIQSLTERERKILERARSKVGKR